MRYSGTKMATNSLASGSSYALIKFTPRIVLLILVLVFAFVARISEAINPNDGKSYDYANSRQFRKNIAVSKYKNNTFWLPEFQWTEPKLSTEPKKRPKWETNDDSGDNKSKVEKSEWQKKMEEISRQEREKWKKYRKEKSESSSSFSQDRQNRFSRSFNDQTANDSIGERSRNGHMESEIPKARKLISDTEIVEQVKRSIPRSEDQLRIFEEIFSDKNETADKNVVIKNSAASKFQKNMKEGEKEEEEGAEEEQLVKPAIGKNSFESLKNDQVKRSDVVGINSGDKNNKTNKMSKKVILDKLDVKTKNNRSREAGKRSGKNSRRNLRTGKRKSNVEDKNSARLFKEMEEFIEKKKLSPEDVWRSRWGMMTGSEPPDKIFDDISRNKNNVEGIQEDAAEEEEENKKQSGGLETSQHQKSQGRKNLILKSKNEYWIRDDNREGKDPSKKLNRLSKAFKKSPQFFYNKVLRDAVKNDKFIETDSRSSGASKLIKIIIAPNAAVASNAVAPDRMMELSIDPLIPESNGDSRMMEFRPIVIGLSTTLCDKHR